MGEAGKAEEVTQLSWGTDDCYEVMFSVGKSRRYHAYMREFFRTSHNWSVALSVLSGSAAFVSLIPSEPNLWIPRILAFVVAVAAAIDLVFDLSKRADAHDALCRQFTELAARIAEWEATPDRLKQACAERIRIEAGEPTERRLIDLWAHNDELRARGVRLLPLTRLQYSPLAYVFTFGIHGLQRRLAERDEEVS